MEPCDVQEDAEIERVFEAWKARYGTLDILVHAVAFAKREELDGTFVDTSRDGFAWPWTSPRTRWSPSHAPRRR